ncbi:MAG TPA: hypothetical protein VMB79_13345 [Jatrophihabitans sp.]|nr:hypothetical protein [Jatrophihabitans sp.]
MTGRARAALAVLLLCAGCTSAAPGERPSRPSVPASSSVPATVLPPATNDYGDAVRAAVRQGLHVWLEADLVKRWQQGPASFRQALRQLSALASIHGVAGIKIADELGYHDGLTSAARISAFLGDAARGLRQYAPGKPLLVDMIVPSLGCLPVQSPPLLWSTECQVKSDGQYPQLSLPAVTGYLRLHDVAVLDLSTGLLPDTTYAGWGVTRDIAQQQAWAKVGALGWGSLVTLHARKALAHPGDYPGTSATAESDLRTWVDLPLRDGARAVDVWTWRQQYQGALNRLLDPGLRPNPLWDALLQRRAAGDQLVTHLSPHSLEVGLDADLAMLARVFTAVFIAAGTG